MQSPCGSLCSHRVAAKSPCGSWQVSHRVAGQSPCGSWQLIHRVAAHAVTVWQLMQSPCGSSCSHYVAAHAVTVWQAPTAGQVAITCPGPQASCGSLEIALGQRRTLLLPCRIWDKNKRVEGLLVLEAHSFVLAMIVMVLQCLALSFPNS